MQLPFHVVGSSSRSKLEPTPLPFLVVKVQLGDSKSSLDTITSTTTSTIVTSAVLALVSPRRRKSTSDKLERIQKLVAEQKQIQPSALSLKAGVVHTCDIHRDSTAVVVEILLRLLQRHQAPRGAHQSGPQASRKRLAGKVKVRKMNYNSKHTAQSNHCKAHI